jgi:hypothetical protein
MLTSSESYNHSLVQIHFGSHLPIENLFGLQNLRGNQSGSMCLMSTYLEHGSFFFSVIPTCYASCKNSIRGGVDFLILLGPIASQHGNNSSWPCQLNDFLYNFQIRNIIRRLLMRCLVLEKSRDLYNPMVSRFKT